jgi:hypothetical protein
VKALIDRAREEYWALCWKLARVTFGLHSVQALWCEDRWAEAWWRQRKQRAEGS